MLRAASTVEHLWPEELRRFSFERSVQGQQRSLNHYFVKAFQYHEEYTNQNVLDFAVKRTRSVSVHSDNWSVYETYLLKAGRSNPLVIPAIVELLAVYNNLNYSLNKDRILKFVGDIIQRNAPLGHHMEVAWALFLLKELGLKLQRNVSKAVCQLNSSVCALIALDLESQGQIVGRLDKSHWTGIMSMDGLRSSMWLLAYEGDLKGWLNGRPINYVQGDPYFKELKASNISFYDARRSTQHIRKGAPSPVAFPPIDNMARSIVAFS